MDDVLTLKVQARRAAKRIAKTYTFDGATVDLLNLLVGNPKGHGMYLSKLVHAEAARLEERARLRAVLTEALTGAK